MCHEARTALVVLVQEHWTVHPTARDRAGHAGSHRDIRRVYVTWLRPAAPAGGNRLYLRGMPGRPGPPRTAPRRRFTSCSDRRSVRRCASTKCDVASCRLSAVRRSAANRTTGTRPHDLLPMGKNPYCGRRRFRGPPESDPHRRRSDRVLRRAARIRTTGSFQPADGANRHVVIAENLTGKTHTGESSGR